MADDTLTCLTCGCEMTSHIYQCSRGHSSCNVCKNYNRPCAICDQPLVIRNFALESYTSKLREQCPNRNNGCNRLLKATELQAHVEECSFQSLKCPAGCRWRGKLEDLYRHCSSDHPELCELGVNTEVFLDDIYRDSQNVFLLLIDNLHFIFHIKVSEENKMVYMTVQLIGSRFSASKWFYEVHVYNKNEYRRKYTFSDECKSFAESVDDIFNEGRCLVLPHEYASTFLYFDSLTFKIFINEASEI